MKKFVFGIVILLITIIPQLSWTQSSSMEIMLSRMGVEWNKIPKKVLAFYYGWYGNPQFSERWVHWSNVDKGNKNIGNSTHYPKLEPYDSHNPEVVEQHCRWAKEAGIDALIVSWWHPNDFHDKGMPLILDTAQKFGLEVTVYLETVPNQKREDGLTYVDYLIQNYSEHPAWLKLKNRPVIFIYGRAINQIGLNGWLWIINKVNQKYSEGIVFIGDRISKNSARVFDGIHTYNITGSTQGKSPEEIRQWAQNSFPQWITTAGKDRISCITIIPGYDDSKLGRPEPRPITDRHNGETYRILWQETISANPDWILITSWNEWHEGSEIEPSVENGDRESNTTVQFARRFKNLPPRSTKSRKFTETKVSKQGKTILSKQLKEKSIAVLPNSNSEGLWFLPSLDTIPTILEWEQVVDPEQFNPETFPITLYAGGESYRPTLEKKNDVLHALQQYICNGGTLMVLPSNPLPFHYDEQHNTISHWKKLGMPMSGGWETPQKDKKLTFVVSSPDILPNVSERFPFPKSGDHRWRPILPEQSLPNVQVKSLMKLKEKTGKSCGTAVALLNVGKGHIVYAWFRLLETSEGTALLYDLWKLGVDLAGN